MTATQECAVLVHGGEILVGGPDWRTTEALVAIDGRVVACGSFNDMSSRAGAQARRVDLQGAVAMPGLIDSHPHALHFAAFEAGQVNLLDARNHAEIIARIRERAASWPKGQWIQCTPIGEPHYFIRRWYTDLAEGRLPNAVELDAATSDHPAIVTAWAPRTPNIVALNSRALRELGIDRSTPDRVHDVFIEKDNGGQPTGILTGAVNNYYTLDPFWTSLMAKMGAPPPELWSMGAFLGQQQMHRLGVTAAYEAHSMEPDHILAWRNLRDAGALTLRVHCAVEYSTGFPPTMRFDEENHLKRLGFALSLRGRDDEMFSFEGLSYGNGGPCWPGLLVTSFPYRDPFGRETRGVQFISEDHERKIIEYCLDNDIRLNVVQGGDKNQDDFFRHLDAVLGARSVGERGWVSQHNILIRPEHIERLAELGMAVSTSISFLWGKGDMYEDRMGSHVHDYQVPMKRMVDAGLMVACGSDWGPKNVFEQIALQETCTFCGSGRSVAHLPGHGLTRKASLDAWTKNGAHVMGRDDLGSLTPGKRFDMTIIDRNPLSIPVEDLPATKVLRTFVGGTEVYAAN